MAVDVLRDFYDCYDLLSANCDIVDGETFYRDIFPDNENTGDMYNDFSHPNAIYLYRDDDTLTDAGRHRMRRRIMLADTWADDYMTYVEANGMALCGGLTYRGRYNRLQNAQAMNAMIFDIDYVGLKELRNVLYNIDRPAHEVRSIAPPTYIVLSGRGLHLYYVFDRPVQLYPNIKPQLKALKYNLTYRFWNPTITSRGEEIQFQGIAQGFRMVGSVNGKYGNTVTAFRYGDGERVTVAQLNSYATRAEDCVEIAPTYHPSRMSRDEAQQQYPEWYQRVVVERQPAKKWAIGYRKKSGVKDYALYDWWRGKVNDIKGGHRYFYMMCLVIYAVKCDVPKEKLEEDIQSAYRVLQHVDNNGDDLTQDDVASALKCYSKNYYNFTIDDIEHLCNVRIERNRRNGRTQEEHLKRARAVEAIDYPNGSWRNVHGRPDKLQQVYEWRLQHPDGRKIDCERDTGLDPKTIRKWWDVPEESKPPRPKPARRRRTLYESSIAVRSKPQTPTPDMADRVVGVVTVMTEYHSAALALMENENEEEKS